MVFEALCKENGKLVTVSSLTKGGRRLIENKTKNDDFSISVREAVAGKEYSVLILQDQSLIAIDDNEGFENGIRHHVETIKADRYVLYATWGRKDGSDKLTERSLTSSEMNSILSREYHRVAKLLGCEVSAVGDTFEAIKTTCPDLELYKDDKSHPSYLGSCVAATVHYKTIFREMPASVKAFDITEEIADRILSVITTI